ncbi:hypothetical protein AFL01nite_10030 [Aeromicrobium flavum]|uniref:Uncharacterized protein n=1 Tax=Aeromicrobium flavum TaxID=416568 RepID=A0A512HT93_9ACTN|nr:hypothetical protein [Aeromicrobium flavum]GEO88676.1 hypothetical protein AFL01nite_10030 [Aeromicrobium flavum]
MNPRHRRLLIPGLLLALIVVVVVASLIDRADAAPAEPLVTVSDSRITESSGLVVSAEHDDLAYTVNDSGNAPEVFAIDLTTGEVVGVTTVRADLRDVEALALRDGRLWIGDVGDNDAVRDDIALHVIDEPGRAGGTVDAQRFPVALAGGPADVEALLAPAGSDRLHLVTKSLGGGSVLSVDVSDLAEDRTATAEVTATGLPALVTDGAASPDGSQVALLSYASLWTIDPEDWTVVGSRALPPLDQAETVAFVGEDAVLVGSEGKDSPLYRLSLPAGSASAAAPATVTTELPKPTPEPSAAPAGSADDAGFATDARTVVLGGVGVAAVLGLVVVVALRRAWSGGSRRALR